MARRASKAQQTYTVQPGSWLVLMAHESGSPVILSVEPDQQQALAWREELVRRLAANPGFGHVLTDHTGRVFLAPALGGLASALMVGSPFTGPREILVLRVETPLSPLPHAEAVLHKLLPGRFPE